MGRNLLSVNNLTINQIEEILLRAQFFQDNKDDLSITQLYKNKFVINFFLEPSTRTRFSFEIAEKRLGCRVINFQSNDSSIKKGESLYDTLKTLEVQGIDAAVIRIREEDVLENLSQKLSLTIVNAGEGIKEHPTQALLDLYTIRKYFKELKGLNVAIIGDVAHSRVARSNYNLLKNYGVNFIYSGPNELMAEDLEGRYLSVDEAIKQADVVMMLRIQLERQNNSYTNLHEDYNKKYGFTTERLQYLQSHAIILHPAPVNRGVEMDDDVVEHKQSKIFEQMNNGVWIRMAVIEKAI
ncbi:MAG: aspartate carbamoyltransferase catalytic subunit [Vulcanibacillus sp.]